MRQLLLVVVFAVPSIFLTLTGNVSVLITAGYFAGAVSILAAIRAAIKMLLKKDSGHTFTVAMLIGVLGLTFLIGTIISLALYYNIR